VRETPLASLVLVQLLRHGEGLREAEGLVAESLAYGALQAGPEFARWRAAHPARTRPAEVRPPLRVVREGARLGLVLDRPERRNALSFALRDALCEALAVALADPGVGEIELCAEGPDFCAGGDLDEFGTAPDPATAHAVRSTRSPARLLAECGERALARVQGACVGAGVELAAFCRRIEAREGAFFQLPERPMGLVPGAGGTVSLPRRIGRERTAWLALTGARIDARTALAWGLVDAVE
jgi:enoyl-CoA hydratase/carnithine racemase